MRIFTSLKNASQKVSSDRKGSVAILFGFAFLPAMMFMGVSIDYVRAQSAKQALQMSADGAALAGANMSDATDQQRIDLATAVFAANFPVRHFGTAASTVTAANSNVSVTANLTLSTIFAKMMNISSFSLSASAVSPMAGSGGVACMLALSPDQGDAIHVQGTNNFQANGCWAWANSTSGYAISGGGSAVATATGFCAAGGYLDAGNYTPTPKTNCLTLKDPYAGKLSNPSSANCTSNNGTSYTNGNWTISPGTFCGGLELKPQANVTFNPGIYVIKNGPLTFQAGSYGTGTGVVFVLIGENAYLNVKGGAAMQFKAPSGGTLSSGKYDGFIIIKNATSSSESQYSQLQGGGSVTLDGVIYLPKQDLYIGGNGDLNMNSKLFATVANRFYLQGNGTLYYGADAVGAGFSKDLLPKIPGAGRLIN